MSVEELRGRDPRRVGAYEVLGRLGAGGMGQVYLAAGPDGPAALKVVHPGLAAEPRFRERFRREVAAGRRLSAPWVAPVVAADPDAATPWLATAYVPGPSLDRAVAAAGPLPATTAHHLAAWLAEALVHVHDAGLVHRDIKPSNIVLGPDRPCLVDLGIARAVEGTQLTTTGSAVGTPAYMSPEQARADPAAPASDVFSLGAVLAFAATARAPFGDGDPFAVLLRIADQDPELTGVPEPLHDVVAACLAKAADERPTAEELVALLRPVPPLPFGDWRPEAVVLLDPAPPIPERAVAPPEAAGDRPVTPGPPRSFSRRALLAGAGLVGVGVLAGAGAAAVGGRTGVVTGAAAPAGVTVPTPRWSTPLGSIGKAWSVWLVGGRLFATGVDSFVRLDPATGRQMWRHDLPKSDANDFHEVIGVATDGARLLAAAGRSVYALDLATGTLSWTYQPPGDHSYYPVAGTADRVYVGIDTTLIGLDPASGREVWTRDFGADRYVGDLLSAGDRAFVTVGRGLDVVDADGQTVWEASAPAPDRGLGMLLDGTTVVTLGGDPAGSVAVLDADTGQVRRTGAVGVPLSASQFQPFSLAGGMLTVPSGGRLHAFDTATGFPRWTAPDPATGNDTISIGPVATASTVYAVTESQHLVAFDAQTGTVRWSLPRKGSYWGLAAADDMVFLSSQSTVEGVAVP